MGTATLGVSVGSALGYEYRIEELSDGHWHGNCEAVGATWLINSEQQGHDLAAYMIQRKLDEQR